MADEKVLIIEDNPMNLELATDLLEVAGYRVVNATDGERGVALAHTERPDIILMDIDLPGISGLEATKRLKGNPEFKDTPIVALTAFAMKADMDKILAAGCEGCLTKPIDTRRFAHQVADFIHPDGDTP